MVLLSSLAVVATVASLATCQNTSTIDPSTVLDSTRKQWCESQTSACPLICLQLPGASGSPKENKCDFVSYRYNLLRSKRRSNVLALDLKQKSLVYSCICSNNQSPNASEYSQTIPYFECTEKNNQCVKNCDGEQQCHTAQATTSLPPFTGVPDKNGVASRPSADLNHIYGLAVVMAGFFAGFATLL
ncbi:hypothetical protein BDV35DRAFT_407571 [Aspergillus flavus]|uniref:DNA, SC005 n=3 Tax=Aspergillus subgen. Circumdati TaxID=2720871 RepID=Q2URX6_ASPOR|nr:unnamed protein product [Aspergillus oryzae RIB40]EIT74096.1 hypothetical protein Ao3042_09984 [Aspergillus oryzae 3.042]KAB8243590.1 hypothetical protein BDV35DRAFT_407571 [Aspergillus flavus]KDE76870.1 hypothetical protein AO1008_02544 [Aspergillus oryzae 100-8]BAE55689.1 unnamed protein product [Aspergillus oryzae RIB40]|eukprot:EIT74096.1 hypothetical protein Ao3042_09984 [Aspergillus oryzae 3.042]